MRRVLSGGGLIVVVMPDHIAQQTCNILFAVERKPHTAHRTMVATSQRRQLQQIELDVKF